MQLLSTDPTLCSLFFSSVSLWSTFQLQTFITVQNTSHSNKCNQNDILDILQVSEGSWPLKPTLASCMPYLQLLSFVPFLHWTDEKSHIYNEKHFQASFFQFWVEVDAGFTWFIRVYSSIPRSVCQRTKRHGTVLPTLADEIVLRHDSRHHWLQDA